MNGVLHHLQQYFSHMSATAHITHVIPGFHQYKAKALKCLAQGQNPEDPVRLEPRTPGLRVEHLITEPQRTPLKMMIFVFDRIEYIVAKR